MSEMSLPHLSTSNPRQVLMGLGEETIDISD